MARLLTALLGTAALLAGGCSDGPPLTRSCNGKTVPNCLPYEYSIVREASLTPDGLEIANPGQEAMVRVVMDTCGEDAPVAHEVVIRVISVNDSMIGDGGATEAVFQVAEVRDDGRSDGDPVAKDGVIEATIDNPFFGMIPANRAVTLRFEPNAPADCSSGTCRGGTCAGEALEVPYRTGPRFEP